MFGLLQLVVRSFLLLGVDESYARLGKSLYVLFSRLSQQTVAALHQKSPLSSNFALTVCSIVHHYNEKEAKLSQSNAPSSFPMSMLPLPAVKRAVASGDYTFHFLSGTRVFLLGDSHVLPSAWTYSDMHEPYGECIFVPALVLGLKAWHVSQVSLDNIAQGTEDKIIQNNNNNILFQQQQQQARKPQNILEDVLNLIPNGSLCVFFCRRNRLSS